MRLERGRPLSLLIGDGGCPGQMAIEARIKNQETELGTEPKEISTGCFASSARESMVEEPGEGKPLPGSVQGAPDNLCPYCDGKYIRSKHEA